MEVGEEGHLEEQQQQRSSVFLSEAGSGAGGEGEFGAESATASGIISAVRDCVIRRASLLLIFPDSLALSTVYVARSACWYQTQ